MGKLVRHPCFPMQQLSIPQDVNQNQSIGWLGQVLDGLKEYVDLLLTFPSSFCLLHQMPPEDLVVLLPHFLHELRGVALILSRSATITRGSSGHKAKPPRHHAAHSMAAQTNGRGGYTTLQGTYRSPSLKAHTRSVRARLGRP